MKYKLVAVQKGDEFVKAEITVDEKSISQRAAVLMELWEKNINNSSIEILAYNDAVNLFDKDHEPFSAKMAFYVVVISGEKPEQWWGCDTKQQAKETAISILEGNEYGGLLWDDYNLVIEDS
ncbi:MAG: hypothetical protein ACIAQZ_02440 [Sedimentisphaeraceae bacterium JB056]